MTIKNLLTHTSGIRDYMQIDYPNLYMERWDFTPKRLIDSFKNYYWEFEPDTKYSYSNSGYYFFRVSVFTLPELLLYRQKKTSTRWYPDLSRKVRSWLVKWFSTKTLIDSATSAELKVFLLDWQKKLVNYLKANELAPGLVVHRSPW